MDGLEYHFEGKQVNDLMVKTFTRMFAGLSVTAIVALVMYFSGAYITVLTGMSYSILAILELVVVFAFSLLYRKASPGVVSALFYTYAFINGITMSVIFAAFEMTTIFVAFITSAALFGALAVYGHSSEKDLTNWGTILGIALMVGIVFSVINIFLRSSMLDIVIDWAILLLFCGITIYDVNKIKVMSESFSCEPDKLYIYCAMDLYLDFINIFIRLVSILGRNSRRN